MTNRYVHLTVEHATEVLQVSEQDRSESQTRRASERHQIPRRALRRMENVTNSVIGEFR